jgi:hypothetical protein
MIAAYYIGGPMDLTKQMLPDETPLEYKFLAFYNGPDDVRILKYILQYISQREFNKYVIYAYIGEKPAASR